MFSCKGRKEKRISQTLVFPIKDGKILLGVKIGGKDFGRGRLNGFGGDQEPGETIEETARRELKEEAGLEVLAMEKRGVIYFFFESEPAKIREVHVFWVSEWSGKPIGSEEMMVQKFPLEKVESLQDRMWAGDRLWLLPMFLAGKKFQGWVFYDSPENNQVVSQLFWEVEKL